ncbi:bifunctional phosphopantothenoylcysteine decarboxylase/phosphopantothenate--cysteine ligase CoaBC [Sphingobacterium hotanense]|uniref:bifunctional phosphopantothenoylcysteine decarboxylase/phosphopantothenate--cysteine ligase CoaBC n=1 Tax=Sphingobacterium hotanense TaxID=649196 RepID=UPI0021A68282|nr:bifunctional phosphopantothenoylcysteine decarboxylase/phosphopantothenate--cysteine ligase CoaBC [Sphingobacterium hotanense]MCT1523647.1 bifunctional phosphopantothenoylcysteine decarboxylase/phosphopantothenate--cysteine ligase CoaBC [Sphingobacterium hotanense]
MSLQGKHIVIGVSGSIAAYKIATLVRLLRKENASVQVMMTEEATSFITPLTLSTLSNNPVLVDYYDENSGEWNNHVHIAESADLILIAPASANTLSKCALGLCDNILLATYLSAKGPVYFAPAMDLDMWKHPAVQHNISLLKQYGHQIIPPGNGELASGLIGEGRLAEPEDILLFIQQNLELPKPLSGKKALVSAGPTYEAIDPVRFIGNHSSGKMGYAIAKRLQELGAEVTLVSGPTALSTPQGVQRVDVTSAKQMLDACEHYFPAADITVMSAAVADYTPEEVATQKIKKKEDHFSIPLTKTTDILATLGGSKKENQLLIGFALETNNEIEHAKDKLQRKNLDFIVLNSMQDKGAGFAHDTNKVTVISRNGDIESFELKSKDEVATDICNLVIRELK